jgi:hypothetical protein
MGNKKLISHLKADGVNIGYSKAARVNAFTEQLRLWALTNGFECIKL